MRTVNNIDDFNGLKKYEKYKYRCKECGKECVVGFRRTRINVLSRFLCPDCNYTKSMLEKYGVRRPAQNKDIQRKVEETKRRLYGDPHYNNQEKCEQTNLRKYGVKSTLSIPEVKEKIKQTNIALYGVDNVLKLNEFQEKAKQTLKDIYGVEHPAQSEEIKDRMKATNKAKYGVENPLELSEIREKAIQTMIDRYCVPYSGMSKELFEKTKQTKKRLYGDEYYTNLEQTKKTMMDRYNCEYVGENPEFHEKSKETCFRKYGVENYSQTKEAQRSRNSKYLYDGEKFDSSLELALWVYAKDHDEDIDREVEPLEYTLNGKTHYYFPDFRYKGELVEIKGDQFISETGEMRNPYNHDEDIRSKAKQQCALENGVKFMYRNDIQFYIDYARNKFGGSKKWYNQFNITPMPDPVQLTPLPMMPMYIYPTIPMMLPWWMFMTPCDFTPFSNNVFEREGMEFVDCECSYE